MPTSSRTVSTLKRLLPVLFWLGGGATGIILIWIFTLSKLASDKEAVLSEAKAHAASLSRAYAEQLRRTVEQIDKISLSLRYRWEKAPGSLNLEEEREAGIYSESSQLYASIIGPDGSFLTTTLISSKAANLSDLSGFQFHKKNITRELLINPPSAGRRTGRTIIRFTRRLENDEEAFAGIVNVAVEPDYLATYHDDHLLGKNDFLSLRHSGGPLLATKRGLRNDRFDQQFYNRSPLFSEPEGVIVQEAEAFRDLQERVVSWKKLENYPFVAITALSTETILAPYEESARTYRSIATAATGSIALFSLVGLGFSLRLSWRRQQAEVVKATYRLATDAANEGFYMIRPIHSKKSDRIEFLLADCNERGAELIGSTRESLVGHHMAELIPFGYRRDLYAVYQQALADGFFEDEMRVSPRSTIKASWLYFRLVRSGGGLALTMRDISEAKAHEQSLANLANTDALTGLPNRHWLSTFLPGAIIRAKSIDAKFALMFIDLDNFKDVNDAYGHKAGDELLKSTAHRLKAVVRSSDHVIRLGGDEFTIVLNSVDATESITRVADDIVKSLSKPYTLVGTSGHRISASVGISIYPEDGADEESLLKHADMAMYAAKSAGKGRHYLYSPALSEALLSRIDKESALRAALDRDEFIIHYQPRISAADCSVTSLEALVRWSHPQRGLIFPGSFIDLAEETGLIIKLGELVIDKVFSQLSQLKQSRLRMVPVSINVSALQLNNGQVSSVIIRSAEKYHLSPSLVEVELTESAVIDQSEIVTSELATLRALGVKLLIDDFGTGYSSLAQLRRLNVDALKIDRSFILELADGSEGEVLIKAIVSMADAFNISTVAEGVETSEQFDAIRALGCDEIQGYYVSKPISAEEMLALMQRDSLIPM